MSLDYKKSGGSHNSDSFWTSYSDLFLGLSTIFLLLYVVSSLRTGTDAIKAQIENQKMSLQVEELKQQLKMYESVKQDYMQNQASEDEIDEYQELMDKLTLLQEDAKSEKDRLVLEALENQNKAKALNKYQQMVRNVLNANKVAKTKIINRNELIGDQDKTIVNQKTDIKNLNQNIAENEQRIKENEQEIAKTVAERDRTQKSLLKAFRANQLTKAQYQAQLKKVRLGARKEIDSLQAQNTEYQSKIDNLDSQLQSTSQELASTNQELSATAQKLHKTKGQVAELGSELQSTKGQVANLGQQLQSAKGEAAQLSSRIGSLQAHHAKSIALQRAAFEEQLNRGRMNAAQRAAKEKAFRQKMADQQRQLDGKIAGLQGALAKAKEEIDARKEIAKEIQKGFKAAGINADINMETGEVVLDFGNHYFESDSAKLNLEMKKIIERAMPVYSKSLFGNKKIADKISAVEIVGFASPTYRGRFVDPRSQSQEDKEALKYNMDLSYQRANSIFSHLLENQKVAFEHQRDLMALMKVSGRSFLEVMSVPRRAPASASEFCKSNDCKRAQRVIVRFSMDGK